MLKQSIIDLLHGFPNLSLDNSNVDAVLSDNIVDINIIISNALVHLGSIAARFNVSVSLFSDMVSGWSNEDVVHVVDAVNVLSLNNKDSGDIYNNKLVLASFLYNAASNLVNDGYILSSIIALLTVLYLDVLECYALCALAICALRQNKIDVAFEIANSSTLIKTKNVRAYCIAGYCELKRDHRKSAQSLLAMAARFARNDSLLRNDMRVAQCLLLSLHLNNDCNIVNLEL